MKALKIFGVLNGVAILTLAWLIFVDVPDGYAATRFRNALIARVGKPADFMWRPAQRPSEFKQETAAVPLGFGKVEDLWRIDLPAPTGLAAAIAIVEHLHEGPGRGDAILSDTVTAYRKIRAERAGYCSDFIQVFNGLAYAAGLPVREWGMSFGEYSGDGHAFSEIFDVGLDKWILIDVFNSLYFADVVGGIPLSVLEVRERMLRPPGAEGISVLRIGPQPIGFPKVDKLMRYYRRGAEEVFLYFGNDVFTYDQHLVVRIFGPVSRALEQIAAIAVGIHAPIYIVPSTQTQGDIEKLSAFKQRMLFKLGLLAVLVITALGLSIYLINTAAIKNGLLRFLPGSVQHSLKKLYYPRIVRSFTESDWPYGMFVRALVAERDRVVDAGANIGYISGLLSRFVGPDGRVFSFEPIPETHDLLTSNIRKLNIENVTIFQVAASSRSGEAQMEIPHFVQGTENYYQSRVVDTKEKPGKNRRILVKLAKLDDVLVTDIDNISFMKIDVEGHELALIQGATRLLSASRPAMLIEVIGKFDTPGSEADILLQALDEFGYLAYLVAGGTLKKWQPGDRAVDYLFLTGQHVAQLRRSGISVK